MFANLSNALDFQAKALVVRAERQRVIASNIANVDTPGYVSRAIDFKQAMQSALDADKPGAGPAPSQGGARSGLTDARHIPLQSSLGSLRSDGSAPLVYAVQSQPSMDGNSVDMDQERASFVDNAVRYEATLRFINGNSKTILSAIQGQ